MGQGWTGAHKAAPSSEGSRTDVMSRAGEQPGAISDALNPTLSAGTVRQPPEQPTRLRWELSYCMASECCNQEGADAA